MADRPSRRIVGHEHVDPRTTIFRGLETNDPSIADERAKLASPRQQLIRDGLHDAAVPANRGSCGTGYRPAKTVIAGSLHFLHMLHHLRKVFWIRPELEYALDGRMDRDFLVISNGASAACLDKETPQL